MYSSCSFDSSLTDWAGGVLVAGWEVFFRCAKQFPASSMISANRAARFDFRSLGHKYICIFVPQESGQVQESSTNATAGQVYFASGGTALLFPSRNRSNQYSCQFKLSTRCFGSPVRVR